MIVVTFLRLMKCESQILDKISTCNFIENFSQSQPKDISVLIKDFILCNSPKSSAHRQ